MPRSPLSVALVLAATGSLLSACAGDPCPDGCRISDQCHRAGDVAPGESCRVCDPARSHTAWSDRDGARCDDGRFCTVEDTCHGGECVGTARTCDDGVACDGVESCDEDHQRCAPGTTTCTAPGEMCSFATNGCVALCTGCVIDGTCYGAGQTDPANPCRICDVERSATAWSDADGAACDDGRFCTVGDACQAGECVGTPRDCDDGVACNGAETCDTAADTCVAGESTCSAPEFCDLLHDGCVTWCPGCAIDGVCYGAGQTDPANPCRVCDPMRSSDAWSDHEGARCDDGRFCTVGDTCQVGGTCTGTPRDCDDGVACNGAETCDTAADACRPGTSTCGADQLCDVATDSCALTCTGCVIGGSCYGAGQRDPANPCRACDPARSSTAWSDDDGAGCDDGLFCTVGDTCQGGACTGTPRDCDDGIACNGAETCDPAADACRAGTPTCGTDQLCDPVADRCVPICTGCVIGAFCFPAGEVDPWNPCLGCDPTENATGWSSAPRDGVACDDGRFCTVEDQCAGGSCGGVPRDCSGTRECDDGQGCDEATASCQVSVAPVCAASPECEQACTVVGDTAPFFVLSTSPASVPTAGGELTLTGFFGDPASVVVAALGVPLPIVSATATEVVVTAPPGSADTELTATGQDGLRVSMLGAGELYGQPVFSVSPTIPLRYLPPVVTSVSGCLDDGAATVSCPVTGGVLLTMAGEQLGNDEAGLLVDVGGVSCTDVVLTVFDRELQCWLPAVPAGGFDLPVTVTRYGASGTLEAALSYVGPVISEMGLFGVPAGTDVMDLDPNGGDAITLWGSNLAGGSAEVLYGPAGHEIECMVVSQTDTEIDCVTSPGAGMGYPLHVRVGEQWARPTTGTLSYMLPVIVASSLRGALSDPGQTSLPLLGFPSTVYFDVEYLPSSRADLVSVSYGDGSAAEACHDPQLVANGPGLSLSCTVFSNLSSAGAPMGPSVFVLRVPGGESAESTDQVVFPAGPSLAALTGCTDDPPTTRDCPTEGGSTITVTGSMLDSATTLTVGGAIVPYAVTGPGRLVFTLPEGSGTVAVQAVLPAGILSPPLALGYAAPVVERVSGCLDRADTTDACPQAGGVPITIDGHDFGPSGALVIVGGQPCTGVEHDPVTPHRRITCTLPAGSGLDVPVYVVSGGAYSNAGMLSYLEP